MLAHDLWSAVRNLIRRPGFALTGILLLALGAGANAAVFSVVRGVLLRPLPFDSPGRLVAVWPGEFVLNDEVAFWRERAHGLSAVATVSPGWLMALASDAAPAAKMTAAKVSDNLFTMLGVTPAIGRTLADGDSAAGSPRVVVLSDALWRQRFAATPPCSAGSC